MMKKNSKIQTALRWISLPWFFGMIVGLLVLQAAWIALSGNYPMAFDEDYHLGLIRLFAEHINPIWGNQPPGADVYGAVARDPSYIYHYLMSFPYRIINLFTDNLMTQVLLLRSLQIALFAGCLVIYRRLLLLTGASQALVHVVLLVFVLIPVVPLLAAQINYDSLFIPAVGFILLITAKFDASLSLAKPYNAKLLVGVVALGLFSSLIKYAFLPIFAAVLVYLSVRLWQRDRSLASIWKNFRQGFRALNRPTQAVLVLAVLLTAGLCAERYGYNIVRYHTPVPDCSSVLSVDQCGAYGPWLRDYTLEMQKTNPAHGPHSYMWLWLNGMWLRLFFAVDGPHTDFQTRGPFVIPAMSAVAFAVVSVLLILLYGRQIFVRYNQPVLSLLGVVTYIYIAALWLDGYEAYSRTGSPVAINGRYLLPVLPFLFLFAALAFSEALKRRVHLKLAVSSLAIICLLWGGGALTYILRSNDAWYWPSSPTKDINHALQQSLGRLTPGYDRPTQYLR